MKTLKDFLFLLDFAKSVKWLFHLMSAKKKRHTKRPTPALSQKNQQCAMYASLSDPGYFRPHINPP